MIHELRTCRCMPGRLPALLSRVENHTLRLWETHGVRPLGIWTTASGEGNQQLTCMLSWRDISERDSRWNAFLTDPRRIATVIETEKEGSFVRSIGNQFLSPVLIGPATR